MAENLTNQEWRSIAKEASTGQDAAKLTSLWPNCAVRQMSAKSASVSAPRITDFFTLTGTG